MLRAIARMEEKGMSQGAGGDRKRLNRTRRETLSNGKAHGISGI